MISKIRAFLTCSVLLAGPLAAEEVPLAFSGVLTDGEKTRFALTDKTSGQTTWVETGDELGGYTIGQYDPNDETVTLKKGLEEFPVRLATAKPIDAAATTADTLAQTNESATIAIKNNLRQLAVAARQFQLETGATTATIADLVGPDKYIKQLAPVAGENYAGLVFGPGATNLSVTTGNGITVAIDTAPALGALVEAAATPASTATPAADTTAASPAPTGPVNTSHVVREGDTLPKIAEAVGLSVEQLQALNPDVNPSSLKVGQPIRIR